MNIRAERLQEQITSILTAWGMPPERVRTTADVMVDTDLAGIDSHGISMLMLYEKLKDEGRLNLHAAPCVVRETAVTALLDAGGGLGHPAAVQAMTLAIDKASASGVSVVAVHNSNHFGATGYYAAMAARQGLIGMVTSTTPTVTVVPTHGARPMLGTNPLAFAAPARRNRPFVLDMSSSTVAANKVKVYDLNGKPLPVGWVVDEHGQPITDATRAMDYLFERDVGGLTPLGGTEEMSSHKGYGLSVMVQLLAATLSGGAFSPSHKKTHGAHSPDNLGHFFLAIDPAAFRPAGAFEDDLDHIIDELHATPASVPERPVLVAGDPEAAMREQRRTEGIPLPHTLLDKVRAIAERCNVPFVLDKV